MEFLLYLPATCYIFFKSIRAFNLVMNLHHIVALQQTSRFRLGIVANVLLLLTLTVNNPVHAKLYKWVDDQGNVTYSQQKPPDRQAETIELKGIESPDPDAREKLEVSKEQAESDRKNREFAKNDEDISETRHQRHKKNCEIARQNVRILKSSSRIQDKDEKGQPVYLDAAGISAKLAQAQRQIKDYCE